MLQNNPTFPSQPDKDKATSSMLRRRPKFTNSEQKVCDLLVDSSVSGNQEIAERLWVSLDWVEKLVQSIYNKLELEGTNRNRFSAVCLLAALDPKAKQRMEQNFTLPMGW